ncbi:MULTISPECIES: hypothetical protein [Chryseobacterium]|uniref:hypothetical protein n=1 Tax=Chryseobacterium TaxID=59732 RepID=UPI000FBB78F9|nr:MULTISPECIES: hypothetical protein [Chryseobacterium]MBM7421602.1 hypothetical protein [Chryseobacterium sp. JUb44]MDH6211570.1 hypothetical protein [Chryseobacterium sp. BIGb0186]WSO10213.1 hypothetical protein VUJ64_20660 [Chryseobacterium scophthalmum]
MRTKILLLFLLGGVEIVFGQEKNAKYADGLNENKANEIYIEKNSIVGLTNMRSDFSVDVSKDFAASLKLNIESKNKNFSFLIQNDIGSTNSYTPLFSKGDWAVNNSLGITAKWHFKTSRWVFQNDYELLKTKGLSDDLIYDKLDNENKLSQYRTQWLSAGLQWDYKEFLLLADDLSATIENPLISDRKSSYVANAAWNMLWVTSYKHGIYITTSVGYSFQNKGTNYEKLTEVTVRKSREIRDNENNILNISETEEKGRKGVLIISDAHKLFADLHLTFAPPKYGLGFDLFVLPSLKFIENDKIFNIRTGLNVAVTKEDKSKINIGFVVDLKNIGEPFKDRDDRQNRIVPGLIIGVPIPSLKTN